MVSKAWSALSGAPRDKEKGQQQQQLELGVRCP
jgi:hypothetical protein